METEEYEEVNEREEVREQKRKGDRRGASKREKNKWSRYVKQEVRKGGRTGKEELRLERKEEGR